jgi:hypothetical protein
MGRFMQKNLIRLPFTIPPPLRSPPSVLQLVSELVRSLVVLNRLCDPEGDMEKCVIKLVVFNDEDFGYWKNQTHNYLLS